MAAFAAARRFQSTPSVWRATDAVVWRDVGCVISIHALRVEGDRASRSSARALPISIHALRVEGDWAMPLPSGTNSVFQSTPSVWRATWGRGLFSLERKSFQSTPSVWRATTVATCLVSAASISIHALRVEGDPLARRFGRPRVISIHALRVEGDAMGHPLRGDGEISIHALRVEGDGCARDRAHDAHISIHALRVEGDFGLTSSRATRSDFNPRPPCGGRRHRTSNQPIGKPRFQSTPSVWRATGMAVGDRASQVISIHALRVEGDERRLHRVRDQRISIHALRVEGDRERRFRMGAQGHFNPRPPCGGRQ